MTEQQGFLEDFLSRFPDNLLAAGTNDYLPQKFEPFIRIYKVHDFYAETAKFYDMREVPPSTEYPFLRGKGRRCYVIGGGKTVERFDFGKLSASADSDDLIISINGGSCYSESDVIFYSGGVTVQIPTPYGPRGISANGGLLTQYPYAHSPRPQLVVLPYFYDRGHEFNVDMATKLQTEYQTSLMNVEYSDLWAWESPKGRVEYETFAKAIRKKRLFGMGADFGMMAIACALMWGAEELYLVGFDGRFIEASTDGDECEREKFFETMWAGDQEMYARNFDSSLTRRQYRFLVSERNQINETLFGYLRRYCSERGVRLSFLTPSIHARNDEYVDF